MSISLLFILIVVLGLGGALLAAVMIWGMGGSKKPPEDRE